MTITRRALLAAPAILALTPAAAQAGKITLVVPFPPGGSTDAMARLLQSNLQTKLNRIVVVENKSGAAGALGAAQVAKSPADGSSFLVTFDSHAVIPSILDKPPVDVERELMPVFLVGTAPYVIAAGAGRPYKSFADVVAACKATPGAVKYASVGIGTLGHLAMTVLGNKAGVEITHVPYRGGGPAMNDVLGGHVDLIAGSAALVAAQLGTNLLRPILPRPRTAAGAARHPDRDRGWLSGLRDARLVGHLRARRHAARHRLRHGHGFQGDPERARDRRPAQGHPADDAAARGRARFQDLLRQAGRLLGQGGQGQQYQGLMRPVDIAFAKTRASDPATALICTAPGNPPLPAGSAVP
jgi:hypothetical protein